MEVTKATIEWIGEIETHTRKKDSSTCLKVAIDVSTNSTPKTRYVIFQNKKNWNFDLIKDFQAKVYSVGDKIDFDYNEPTGNWHPTIWRIANHIRSDNTVNSNTAENIDVHFNCPACGTLLKTAVK